MSISTSKPEATKPSRFSKAKEFATDTNVNTGIEESQTPDVKLKATKTEPTKRENFDLDIELGKQMRRFILDSKKFQTKRDFLTQCLKDGLEKYAGQ